MFDIVTTACDNIPWAGTFLTSLSKTLHNKNRKIYIFDSSDNQNHAKLLEDISQYPDLEIHVKRVVDYNLKHDNLRTVLTLAMQEIEPRFELVCIIDLDVVMILPEWDAYIEDKINQGYTLIAASPRYKSWAESNFCVGNREIFLESKFADKRGVKDWNPEVMKEPEGGGEIAAMTYHHLLHNAKYTDFRKRTSYSNATGLGYVLMDDKDRELLYHNTLTRYLSDKFQLTVEPKQWEIARFNKLKSNADKILQYLEEEWPKSLHEFIQKNVMENV